MISWSDPEQRVPTLLTLLAIAILLASLYVMLLVPMPSTAGLATGRARSQRQLEREIEMAKEREKQARLAVQPRLWSGTQEGVTASVLALLNNAASQRQLRLGAFRPQRVQTVAGMQELPFSVQVAGPYPAVRAFLTALDSTNSRIALRSLQIASADAASSSVTATLGVSVYRDARPPKSPQRSASGG